MNELTSKAVASVAMSIAVAVAAYKTGMRIACGRYSLLRVFGEVLTMAEVELNGLVFIFEDDLKLFELLDANADDVREVHND